MNLEPTDSDSEPSDELKTIDETQSLVASDGLVFGTQVSQTDDGDIHITIPEATQSLVRDVVGLVKPSWKENVGRVLSSMNGGTNGDDDGDGSNGNGGDGGSLYKQSSITDVESRQPKYERSWEQISDEEIRSSVGGNEDNSRDNETFDIESHVSNDDDNDGCDDDTVVIGSECLNDRLSGNVHETYTIKTKHGIPYISIPKTMRELANLDGNEKLRIVKNGHDVLYLPPKSNLQKDAACLRKVSDYDNPMQLPYLFDEGDVVTRDVYENCIKVSLAEDVDSDISNTSEAKRHLKR